MRRLRPVDHAFVADQGFAMPPLCIDLSRTSYRDVYLLQQQLVQARYEGRLREDCFLVTEHFPVYTLGRRGGQQFLHLSSETLAAKGIELVHVERGGEITYHGLGQLVVYPIVSLRNRKIRVTEYVKMLEEVMIQLARLYDVCAMRNCRNPGVWTADGVEKLGSIGIAIRHGISYHGLALNVDIDLEPFGWITPCGLEGVKVNSLAKLAKRSLTIDQVKKDLPRVLISVFGDMGSRRDANLISEYWPENLNLLGPVCS